MKENLEELADRYGVHVEYMTFPAPLKAVLMPVKKSAVLGISYESGTDDFLFAEAIGYFVLGYLKDSPVHFVDFFEQEITPQLFSAIKWGMLKILPHSKMIKAIQKYGYDTDAIAESLSIDKNILYLRFQMSDLYRVFRFSHNDFRQRYLFLDHPATI